MKYIRYECCDRVFHILMAPGKAWCPVCGKQLEEPTDDS